MTASPTTEISTTIGDLLAQFPWMDEIGIPEATIRQWLVDFPNDPFGLVNAIRSTTQWAARFPGLRMPDGSLRDGMREADYINREAEYRTIMSYFGDASSRYDAPSDFTYFFTNNIRPQELQSRFELWTTLDQGSADIKQAFYVYANMDVTTDDLYEAIIQGQTDETSQMYAQNRSFEDLAARLANSNIMREYEARTGTNPPTYEEWSDRLTTYTITRAQEILSNDPTLEATLASNTPEQLRAILDELYAAAHLTEAGPVALPDLERAFQLAVIGSAATSVKGTFTLPDKAQVIKWLDAGVQRSQALAAYSKVAVQGAAIQASLHRAGFNAFTNIGSLAESLMEIPGGGGTAVSALGQTRIGLAATAAAGAVAESGAASVGLGRSGRLEQVGVRETGTTR